jgi:hypothetical protein
LTTTKSSHFKFWDSSNLKTLSKGRIPFGSKRTEILPPGKYVKEELNEIKSIDTEDKSKLSSIAANLLNSSSSNAL